MVVASLEHAKRVFDSLRKVRWLATDTETQSKPQFKGKKDALVYPRMDVRMWSICYMGVSYSFPTNKFDPRYPLMSEWLDLFESFVVENEILLVFANAGYDLLVTHVVRPNLLRQKFYDVIIGGWLANPTIDKSLKTRAPLYGRHLGSLKISKDAEKQGYTAVSMNQLKALGEYAEEDVIATDEMFQMQTYGYVERPITLRFVKEDGTYLSVKNPMPTDRLVIKSERLREFGRQWMQLQEFPVLDSVIDATIEGFPVLKGELMAIREKLVDDEKGLLKQLYRAAGKKINLRSKPQVAELLHKIGIPSPFRTKTGRDKVDSKSLFKLQMHNDNPVLGSLIQLSKIQKLLGYVKINAPDQGLFWYIADDGKIHCTQNSIGAVTGRFSSTKPNLHQIPSQADLYGMKYAFVAPGITWVNNTKLRPKQKRVRWGKPKRVLICFDYSQLEIRMMCMFSKCASMERILRDPEGDIHQDTSDQFSVDRDPTAKQINFLLQFGGAEYALAEKLTTEGVPTTEATAAGYIQRYDEVRPEVRPFRESLLEEHQEKGYITMMFGRRRWLPDIDWSNRWERHKAETTLTNNCIQASGQELLKASIIRNDPRRFNVDRAALDTLVIEDRFHRALLKDYARKIEKNRRLYRLAHLRWLLQVHDETLNVCDYEAAEDIANMIGDVMSWRHFFPAITDYNIPFVAEGGVGYSWGQAKNKKEALHRVESGYEQWKNQSNTRVSSTTIKRVRIGSAPRARIGLRHSNQQRNRKNALIYRKKEVYVI